MKSARSATLQKMTSKALGERNKRCAAKEKTNHWKFRKCDNGALDHWLAKLAEAPAAWPCN